MFKALYRDSEAIEGAILGGDFLLLSRFYVLFCAVACCVYMYIFIPELQRICLIRPLVMFDGLYYLASFS